MLRQMGGAALKLRLLLQTIVLVIEIICGKGLYPGGGQAGAVVEAVIPVRIRLNLSAPDPLCFPGELSQAVIGIGSHLARMVCLGHLVAGEIIGIVVLGQDRCPFFVGHLGHQIGLVIGIGLQGTVPVGNGGAVPVFIIAVLRGDSAAAHCRQAAQGVVRIGIGQLLNSVHLQRERGAQIPNIIGVVLHRVSSGLSGHASQGVVLEASRDGVVALAQLLTAACVRVAEEITGGLRSRFGDGHAGEPAGLIIGIGRGSVIAVELGKQVSVDVVGIGLGLSQRVGHGALIAEPVIVVRRDIGDVGMVLLARNLFTSYP